MIHSLLRPILFALLFLSFSSGCNLDTGTEVAEAPKKPATPTPPTTPKEDDEENDTPSETFLWKPVSDSSGKLVVLLPASLVNVSSITVSGTRSESSSRSAIGNGKRPHYRFSLPGAAYGKNVRITGGGRTWVVADGSKRTSL
jgi:hypothetical protein